jgi:hypothetical protein
MIRPTVGRVVWYYPSGRDKAAGGMRVCEPPPGLSDTPRNQPLAAIVAYVWSDHLVNLMVIDHEGISHSRTSVALNQDDQFDQPVPYCAWMPFQKGQAQKTDELAKKIDAQERKAPLDAQGLKVDDEVIKGKIST